MEVAEDDDDAPSSPALRRACFLDCGRCTGNADTARRGLLQVKVRAKSFLVSRFPCVRSLLARFDVLWGQFGGTNYTGAPTEAESKKRRC